MKRITILSIFLLIACLSFGANFYWIGGGANSNWNTVGNWSATSGGGSNGSTPSSTSDVFFDGAGASGNTESTISATITVLSLTITSGYTATMTHNAPLTVAGNVTFGANYTISGSSNLTISATSTITSNGKTWPNSVIFSNTATRTLSGNWTIDGNLATSASPTVTINKTTNETLTAAGWSGFGTLDGTAKIIFTGGTWSGSGVIKNDLDIQGNETISGSVAYNTGTLTYVSGTVTTTGSTLTIGASTTLNTDGITFNNITYTNANITTTNNSLLTLSGTLTIQGGSTNTWAGTAGFTCATLTGTSTGGGTLSLKNGLTYTVTSALTLNTTRVGSIYTVASDHATNKAILTLQQGATCNALASFTRIDASGGRTIRTFNGTVTSCNNVVSFNDVGTSKH